MSGSQAVTALVFDASAATAGAAQFDAAGKSIVDANQAVVAATSRTVDAIGNSARALDRLKERADPAYRAQQLYAREVEKATRILQAAGAAEDDRARILAGLADRYDPAIRAERERARAAEDAARVATQAAEREAEATRRAVVSQVADLARLRAAYDPIYIANQRAADAVKDLDQAFRRGQIGAAEYARYLAQVGQARDRAVAEADGSAAAARAAAAADRERARAAEDAARVATQAAERQAEATRRAVASQVADLARLRAAYDPIYVANQRAADAVKDLDQAFRRGQIGAAEYARYLAQVGQARDRAVAEADGSAAAARAAAAAAEQEAAALNRLRAALDPLFAAQQRAAAGAEELARQQTLINAALARGTISHAEHTQLMGAAAAANRSMAGAMSGVAGTARLTTREMQLLSPQLADIGVSLAGGMSPLLVLIQQGPQITDALGGIRRTAMLLVAAINPMTALIATLVAVLGTSIFAAEAQERALANLSNRLRATRNDYEQLTMSVEKAARAAAAGSSIGTADARDAGRIIGGQRNFSGSQADLTGLMTLSERLSIVLGTDVPEAAERLAAAFASPTAAAQKMLSEGLRPMDDGLLRTIQRMENQGRVAEATSLLLDAYRTVAADVAKSPMQKALDEMSQAFTRLWQAIRPIVEIAGAALISILTFVANRITDVVSGLARVAEFVSDSRVSRLLFGEGAAPAAAVAQRSPTDIALERARQANPRSMQREDISDRLAGYRAGLEGATPEQARLIRDAMRELQAQYEGMQGPVADYLRGLREQAQLAGVAEGAARDLAQADLELERAARAAGQGNATASEKAAVREAVQKRLNAEAAAASVALQDQIDAETRVGDAWEGGARAAEMAAIANRAHTEALRYGTIGSVEYTRALNVLRNGYEQLAEKQQRSKDLQEIFNQGQQLAFIRAEIALVGESAAVRERELAALRERQRIQAERGDVNSDESRRRIENARLLADETRALNRQQEAYQELSRIGEQAFERIGSAITQALANGSLKAIDFGNIAKAVFSEVLQAGLRLALINPVLNSVFGSDRVTLGDVSRASGGGSGAGGGSGMGGNLSNLGSLFGGSPGSGVISEGSWSSSLFGVDGGLKSATAGSELGLGAESMFAADAGGGLSGTGGAAAGGFGSALAGIGIGYAGGSMLGGYLAGDSQARQQNAQIGAGGGAVAGAIIGSVVPVIGTMVGAIIGGMIGGGGGGLIGPGKKTNAFGFAVEAENGGFSTGELSTTGDGFGGGQALASTQQALLALNQIMAGAGVSAAGRQIVAGADQGGIGEGQAASLAEALKSFTFSAANDNRLNTALQGRQFDSVEAVASFIQEAQQIGAAVDALKDPVSAFQQQVDALHASFNASIQAAERVGFGEAELTAERDRQVAALIAQRDTQVAVSRAEIAENLLRAQGRTAQADAAQAQREANVAIEAYRDNLKALGLTVEETAPHVAALTEQLVAQQQAAAAALEVRRRVLNQEGDQGYREALAGFTGNAADAQRAELAGFEIRAQAEVEGLSAELKALGFSAESTAIRLGRLTAEHDLERRAIIANYDARRQAAQQALDDRLFATTNDANTQEGALAALERSQARERLEEARIGLVDLTVIEATHAAERAEVLKRFAEQERQAIISAGGSIRSYIDGLRSGAAGGASPQDQFTAAQGIFGRDLTLARGGDRDALGRITQSSDTLLQSGQAMFASGGQFQALRDMVLSSLESLPAVKSYDQLIYEELAKLGGSIQVDVEMAAELKLRADIDAALALIDTSAATPRAKAEAEAALSQLRGVMDAILVPAATTSAARLAAIGALSTITGAIAAIAVAAGITDATRSQATARLQNIVAAVSAITLAPAVPEAVRISASAALASISGAVTSIAITAGVTNATRLAANAALDNIIGVVSLISMAPSVPATVRERANAALSGIAGNVASIALATGVTDAVRTAAIARLSTITGAVSTISMAAAVPEAVRISATQALAEIAGVVTEIAIAAGVTNATRLAANAALDNIIGVVSLISMAPSVPATVRERANAALSGIAGNVASIALATGVTDAVRTAAIARLSTITGAVSAISMAAAVPEAVRISATQALAEISGVVTEIAIAAGVTNATRLAANAALDNIIGVVSLISMNPAIPAGVRERANAALASIAGSVSSVTLAAGVTDSAKAALLRDFGSITAVLGVVTDLSGIPSDQIDVLFASAETITRTLALEATGAALTPDQRDILRAEAGRFDREVRNILTGATTLTADQRSILMAGAGTVDRILRQQVETTETVQISRSIDDKLSGLLGSIKYAVESQLAYLHNLADVRTYLFHMRELARGQQGGLRVTTLNASGGANGAFANAGGSAINWGRQDNFGGLEGGGWVGNGVWNRDSVIARYAGGGDIALAGGEFVTRAPMAARYAPELQAMNAGTFRSNDNSAVVAELREVRQELAQLRRLNDLVQITADAGNQNAAGHKQTARMLDQMRTGQQLARARPA